MRICRRILIAAVCLLTLVACCRSGGVERPVPAVYYWRTTLRLDSAERDFLARHGVRRIYARYFDVVMLDGHPMPNATLRFIDTVPAGVEVVPTVFITENCLRHNPDSIARPLVERIVQMNATNDLPPPRELQIDCDWTQSTQEAYFAFLRRVRSLLAERGMRLSATIRLHQLALPVPPVDEGALMVYNTGDATRGGDHNPILDMRDVEPYLRHLAEYDLPLCAAYPIFGWQLLFDGKGFKAILRDESLGDTTLFRPLAGNRWLVVRNRDLPPGDTDDNGAWLVAGDHVLVWQPAAQEIECVARALADKRPDINNQVIIYHLDDKYLKQYEDTFYETIYHL